MVTNVGRRVWSYFTSTGVWAMPGEQAPIEVVFLRILGLGYLGLTIVGTVTTDPRPSLGGHGPIVLVAVCVLVVAIVVANPRSAVSPRTRVLALAALVAAATALATVQPKGIWELTPYYVGIVAAMRLERRTAVWALGLTILPLGIVAALDNDAGAAVSTVIGAVPWFLVMRQMRRMREQNVALEASQVAEARAAAAAERGRLAREMHDVLAHTLSALALQLESTRLLARDRGVDADVARAVDQAHSLAAGGLDEARRAISTARGDVLPGPERLELLAETFAEQSGLPVALDVTGEPRPLPADARLAVYRTAQEALTNIRRHATPGHVAVRLAYGDGAVELVIEDHGRTAPVAGVPAGQVGDGEQGSHSHRHRSSDGDAGAAADLQAAADFAAGAGPRAVADVAAGAGPRAAADFAAGAGPRAVADVAAGAGPRAVADVAAGAGPRAAADLAAGADAATDPAALAAAAGLTGHGYGLTGMRERAELAGGRLVAEPTGDGFRVELWLPA
jgi:signal transduction histidine kinase